MTMDLGPSQLFSIVQSSKWTSAPPKAILSSAMDGISPGIEQASDVA
jgi:hypothetical protein